MMQEVNKMRSHLNINHTLNQVLKHPAILAQFATRGSNSVPSTHELHNSIESMAEVNVNPIESMRIQKSVESVKEREEKERALEAERHCLAEEEELHRLQQMEKVRITEERTRELQRLREMKKAIADEEAKELQRLRDLEKTRIADEEVKELQRLRDLEKARLAEEEELKRPRELEKVQKDRQQFVQLDQARIATEQAMERLPVKEAVQETGTVPKCMQQEEIGHNATEEQESERQHREEITRVEAQEQVKRRDGERIRKKSQRRREERIREQESGRIPSDKRRKLGAAWIAEAEAKKQPGDPAPEFNMTPQPKPTNSSEASGKMNARVEEDDDDEQVVNMPESEEESEGESDGDAALEAARLTEGQSAANKGRNKTQVNNGPTISAGSAFANMNMRPAPTPSPIPMPSMVQLPPFHSHQPLSPYGPVNTFRPPVMSMHTGYHGQPLYPTAFSPGTTINNVNSGNTSNFSASNINNDNSTKSKPNFRTNTFITIADQPSTANEKEKEVDHIAAEREKSERQRRDEERVHEEQLKCREEEMIRTERKNQPGEINKTKEEKSANITKLTSTPRPKSTDSSKEEEENLANEEACRATNKETKVDRASTPPAQRASTPPAQRVSTSPAQRASTPAQRVSTSTQRVFAKLNEGPTPAPSPASILPVFQPSPFYPRQAFSPDGSVHALDVGVKSLEVNKGDWNVSTHQRPHGRSRYDTRPIPATPQRPSQLSYARGGIGTGNIGGFQDLYLPISGSYEASSNLGSTLQHRSQPFYGGIGTGNLGDFQDPTSGSSHRYNLVYDGTGTANLGGFHDPTSRSSYKSNLDSTPQHWSQPFYGGVGMGNLEDFQDPTNGSSYRSNLVKGGIGMANLGGFQDPTSGSPYRSNFDLMLQHQSQPFYGGIGIGNLGGFQDPTSGSFSQTRSIQVFDSMLQHLSQPFYGGIDMSNSGVFGDTGSDGYRYGSFIKGSEVLQPVHGHHHGPPSHPFYSDPILASTLQLPSQPFKHKIQDTNPDLMPPMFHLHSH
jgi:hypothetical protein